MRKKVILLTLVVSVLLFAALHTKKTEGTTESISVYDTQEEKCVSLSLDEYLTGVVAAEMPSSFESEALRAQAVAARTYYYKKASLDLPEHHGASVCTNPGHCQAYVSHEEFSKRHNDPDGVLWNKVTEAVTSTSGLIMEYDDQPINAVFHAISGGNTETCQEVWGGSLPYLQSVDSSSDKEVPTYASTNQFSLTEFNQIIKEQFGVTPVGPLVGNTEYTTGGGVKQIEIYGQWCEGTKMRTAFGLRSTNFTLEQESDAVTFHVRGYGHGIGMSQYGANAMAKQGYDYRAILQHYYSGIEFTTINN